MKIFRARIELKKVLSGSSTKLQNSILTSCLRAIRSNRESRQKKKREWDRTTKVVQGEISTIIQPILCQCTTHVFTVTIMTLTNHWEFQDLQWGTYTNISWLQVLPNLLAGIESLTSSAHPGRATTTGPDSNLTKNTWRGLLKREPSVGMKRKVRLLWQK